MESIRIIAEFVGGIFLVFITHYLTKSHYERKRKDELEDRDFAGRAAINDVRIRETRDYIDTWADYTDYMWFVQLGIIGENDIENIHKELKYFRKRYPELPQRVQELSKKGVSLDLLNDAELENLHKELILTIRPLTENIEMLEKLPIQDRLRAGKTFDIQNMTSKEFVNIKPEVYEIVTKMKARLDILAQKIP